jgi:EpsI family protein
VRYLIASVTLGVLFAYLTYNTWWKRGLFVLFSIFVPVIANGLRAYMIVMLGHLSGMKLAVGVDHLIYGWVFFGIVVTIMFAIGSIWREPPAPDPVPQDAGVAPAGHRDVVRALAALTLAAAVWPAMGWALSDHGSAVEAVPVAAPVPAPGWSLLDGTSAWDWRPRVVGADGSVYAFYASTQAQGPAPPVGLYLGVYRTQRQGAELVSSANVMIVQKHPVWSDTRMTPVSVRVGDRQLHLLRHEMLSRRGERLLVWSWYAVASHHTANPYVAKLLEAKSRLLGNRGEGALIAIATPYVDDEQAAADRLTRFLDAMLPGIDKEMGRALSASAADD